MSEATLIEQRATAYSAFIKKINDLSLGSLHAPEAEILREAADARMFDAGEEMADAMAAADKLLNHLPERDSFSTKSADELREMLTNIQPASQMAAV